MERRTRILRRLAAALAALIPVSFCAHARAAELVLGEHDPLSGVLSKTGKNTHEGVALAVKEFNRRQKKHTAKLLAIDDQSDPAKAVAAVEELLAKGVKVFAGGYGSNLTGPASEAAIRGGAVYITAGGWSRSLTERGYSRFFAYLNSAAYSAQWVTFLPSLGVKRVSLLAMKKEAPKSVANDLTEGLTKKGIDVVVHDFDAGLEDFKPILNLVKLKDRPDAIVVCAYEKENLAVMRAAQVVRPEVKVIGGPMGWTYDYLAQTQAPLMKSSVGGGVISHPPKFASAEGTRFLAAYRESYGPSPDFTVLFAYELTTLALDAMAAATDEGKLDGDAVAKHIRNGGKSRPVISGTVTFDDKGYNTTFATRLLQYVPGGLEIVWPPEVATKKLATPARSW